MIAAADAHGVLLSGILQQRFTPAHQYAKRVMTAGSLGQPTLGSAYNKWWRSQEYYDHGQWRGTWGMDGGGALMNQGIHAVDLLLWLMGPVSDVYAQTATLSHEGIEVEDTLVATLRFDNGALGVIEAATSSYPGTPRRLELTGPRGTLVTQGQQIVHCEFADTGAAAEHPAPTGIDTANSGGSRNPTDISHVCHRKQLQDVVQAITEGRPPLVDGREARRPVELITAIYQSAHEHRPVHLLRG